MTHDERLGQRIRSLRLAKGYTLRQLATLAGLSTSFVSMLETGKTGVAASRLQAIAEVFGLATADLLPETGSQSLIQTVRVARRPVVPDLGPGVQAQMLVRDLHRRIQPVLLSLEPGARHSNDVGHAGEEFVMVLQGEVALVVDGDQSTVLAQGDSAYYPSALSHSYENVGRGTAQLFTISAPPKLI